MDDMSLIAEWRTRQVKPVSHSPTRQGNPTKSSETATTTAFLPAICHLVPRATEAPHAASVTDALRLAAAAAHATAARSFPQQQQQHVPLHMRAQDPGGSGPEDPQLPIAPMRIGGLALAA